MGGLQKGLIPGKGGAGDDLLRRLKRGGRGGREKRGNSGEKAIPLWECENRGKSLVPD